MKYSKKAQVAIEFLLLTTFGIIMLIVTLAILSKISADNKNEQIQMSIEDLGLSIRNELITASEMENGFNKNLNLPSKIAGSTYTLTLDEGLTGTSYLILKSGDIERYFDIPKISGTIAPGQNIIAKSGNLTITHII